MKKETEHKVKGNGAYVTEETITTTPEDSMVSERVIRPAATDRSVRGKATQGYSTTKTYTTNDPRVTRPFVKIMSGIFFFIGLFMLLLGKWFFALTFIPTAVFAYVKGSKDIDKVEQKLKAEGHDVTQDSSPEAVKAEIADVMMDDFRESAKETFTHDHVNRFTKLTLPIFAVMGIIVSVALSLAVSVIMGIFVLILFVAIGLFYYCVFLKLLVKIFKS